MKNHLPDYWPILKAYHPVREQLYRTIIAECDLPPDGLILDAGCGDAFYSRLIADVLGPRARLIAVDRNWGVLPAQPSANRSVLVCLSDTERSGLRRGTFDAIWLCRGMHSVIDPQRHLSKLASLLKPGGRLIVIENDLAHCPILAWPAEFEQRIQRAQHQYLQSQCRHGAAIDRYHAARFLPTWLPRAGLRHVTLHTYPVEDVAPLPDDVETYWKLAMDYRGRMLQPFLSAADWETYSRAFDPAGPDYVLKQPGFYCLEPTTVAYGIAP